MVRVVGWCCLYGAGGGITKRVLQSVGVFMSRRVITRTDESLGRKS